MILFSIQDLFGYMRFHATMSGIQRVQAGIALHAIDSGDESVGFLLVDADDAYRDGSFLLTPTGLLRDLLVYASGAKVDHDVLRRMADECAAKAETVKPRPQDTIILLGSFWGHGNTLDRFVTARRNGVRIGAYIYDVIPITHPEYCVEELTRTFTISIAELSLFADFIFTISEYSCVVLERMFREAGMPAIPMKPVPLAHVMTGVAERTDRWPAALRSLEGKPYVAYVSTVEGRKNHIYLVNVWKHLIEQGVDVPDLVFVGRIGWRAGGLNDLLDGTRYLDGRVHIVHDLSDAELNGVYAHAAFTAFTSYVEGWGLPVGESLLHGVPCVASNASSIPEVGGPLVDYVDPLNLRDGIAVFRRMIEDPDYLAGRRAAIARDFVPRTWDDVGRDFLTKTRAALEALPPVRPAVPFLAEGVRFAPGDLASRPIRLAGYARSPMRLAVAECFYDPENFGAWMRGTVGHVRFRTALEAGTEINVYLECPSPPFQGGARTLKIEVFGEEGSAATGSRTIPIESGHRHMIRVAGRVGTDGECAVMLSLAGKLTRFDGDSRLFGIGLSAIGYVAAANLAAREELLERFTFEDLTPDDPVPA